MALIITPGASDADAYVSLADANAYAVARGLPFPIVGVAEAPAEQAIRRATSWLDGTFLLRFPGAPATSDQALEWPRSGVMFRGAELPDDAIPPQIVRATIEAAVRELAKPGSLSPDLKRGGKIKEVGAGSARVVFADGAPSETVYQSVEGILASLLGARRGNTSVTLVARA